MSRNSNDNETRNSDDGTGVPNPAMLCRGSSSSTTLTTSLEVRKNLSEMFEQHIENNDNDNNKKNRSSATNNPPPRSSSVSSVTSKIAIFEQGRPSGNSIASATAGGGPSLKPPRPKTSTNYNNNNKNGKKNSASGGDGAKTSLSVFLRVRPPVAPSKSKDDREKVNTIDILPNYSCSTTASGEETTIAAPPTTIRTYPPEESNARKCLRDSMSSTISALSDSSAAVREFQFQQIFGPEQTQEDLYSTVVSPLVRGLVPKSSSDCGESALLFTYGTTNAGKTYTILGNFRSKNENEWGIVPRTFKTILEQPRQQGQPLFDLYLSYFEIYNEQIYDLLPKKDDKSSNSFRPKSLKLRESRGRILVRGLSRHRVGDVQHGIQLAGQARNKRHTSSNNLNKDSSRSHCICQLQLVARATNEPQRMQEDEYGSESECESVSGYTTDEEVAKLCKKGKTSTLWIVDLAGSERSKRTGVPMQRQKEASIINKSLMNLMRCLSVIRDNQTSANSSNLIVPFRDSKLTHLFMNHLTGPFASRTCMIVNVNPAAIDFDETHHVLCYASQAKAVRVDPKEYQTKYSELYGDDEYGYDGRKKPTKKVSKLAALVKKMSPKRARRTRAKRTAATRVGGGSFRSVCSTTASSVSSIGGDGTEPSSKRSRIGREHSSSTSVFGRNIQGTSKIEGGNKKTKSLETSLSIARAECDVLKSENSTLMEELSQIESCVREEVVEEMEEQIVAIKEHYQGIIDNLKKAQLESQSKCSPTTMTAMKKARLEKAEEKIDVLLFQVEECEEEMVRMRKDHEDDISQVHAEYKEILQKKEEKIQSLVKSITAQKEEMLRIEGELRESHAELENLRNCAMQNKADKSSMIENQEILKLKAKLQDSQKEIQQLHKSKKELIDNYEKLLQEDDDDTEDESVEENDPTPIAKSKLEKQRSSLQESKTTNLLSQENNDESMEEESFEEGSPTPVSKDKIEKRQSNFESLLDKYENIVRDSGENSRNKSIGSDKNNGLQEKSPGKNDHQTADWNMTSTRHDVPEVSQKHKENDENKLTPSAGRKATIFSPKEGSSKKDHSKKRNPLSSISRNTHPLLS